MPSHPLHSSQKSADDLSPKAAKISCSRYVNPMIIQTPAYVHTRMNKLRSAGSRVPIIIVDRLRTPLVLVGPAAVADRVPVLNDVAALALVDEEGALDTVNDPG